MSVLAAIGAVTLLANLAVLGLNLKLYTEFFKQCAQRARRDGP